MLQASFPHFGRLDLGQIAADCIVGPLVCHATNDAPDIVIQWIQISGDLRPYLR